MVIRGIGQYARFYRMPVLLPTVRYALIFLNAVLACMTQGGPS